MLQDESKHKQLAIRRGILAVVAMYVFQLLAGIAISFIYKWNASSDEVPVEIIGLASILLSGIVLLIFFWWDIHRSGNAFYREIGLQPSKIKLSKGLFLVITALASTHVLAWIYRSVILPALGHEGIIGGTKMFSYIQTNGGSLEMSGFLLLALLVGPIMEEVVFRGYLQSSLTKKMPKWMGYSCLVQ